MSISSPLINQAIAEVWKLGRAGTVPEILHGLQFFSNHDDTKILLEAYVRPGSDAKECQPFAAALHDFLPAISGVVIFPTSTVEDETANAPRWRRLPPDLAGHRKGFSAIPHCGHDYQVSGGSFFQTNRY